MQTRLCFIFLESYLSYSCFEYSTSSAPCETYHVCKLVLPFKKATAKNALKGFCLTCFWCQTSSTIFLPRNKFYIVSGKVYLDCVHYSFQKMIKSVALYSTIMFHGPEPNHHYSSVQWYIIFLLLLLLSDILVVQHVNFQ